MRQSWMLVLVMAMSACFSVHASEDSDVDKFERVPKEGFIPDKATAVRIGEAILIPIYGAKEVSAAEPFNATLENGTWTVWGTLPPHVKGGTPEAKLSKRSGQVLGVFHNR